MKYRVLWSRRPMSAIEEEEEEGEEGEDSYMDDLIMSSDTSLGCYSSAVTPYKSLLPPPGEACPQGTSILPSGSASLTDILNRIINTATINIVGFEESFASHLSTDACALMWNLCQVYGKTRMAIDLVERELLDTKQEMAHVKHIYEDLSEAEAELCAGIARTTYIRESKMEDAAAWKQEYRRIKDANTLLKLKSNRYQLHLDQMEKSCSDTEHQNQAVKAFLAICREKERSKLKAAKVTRSVSRHPGRIMTGGDNHVNGKYCSTPRRHCPKVTLCLPRPDEMDRESSHHSLEYPPGNKNQVNMYEQNVMQRMTTGVPVVPDPNRQGTPESQTIYSPEDSRTNLPHYTGSAVVTPDIPSRYRKLADAELAEADEQLRSGAKSADIDDVGYVIIPEFELTAEEEMAQRMQAMCGRTPSRIVRDIQTPQSEVAESPVMPEDVTSEGHAENVQSPFLTEGKDFAKEDKGFGPEDNKVIESNSETDPKGSGSSDVLANSVSDSVSTYLSESNGTKEQEKIVHKQTISSQNLQKVTDTSLAFPCHKGTGRYPQLPPFMMARGYSLQKDIPNCTSQSWSSCTSSWTTCRCQRCKRSRTQNYQRPATCTAIHDDPPKRPRPRERAASVMTGKQTAIPPLPCPQHGNKYSGSTTISNESKYVSIKDRKLPPCFPALCKPGKQMKAKVSKSASERPSDKVRAQVRSFSRQVLPVLSPQESRNTRFHQVLLISSRSSEKRPNTSELHGNTYSSVLAAIKN